MQAECGVRRGGNGRTVERDGARSRAERICRERSGTRAEESAATRGQPWPHRPPSMSLHNRSNPFAAAKTGLTAARNQQVALLRCRSSILLAVSLHSPSPQGDRADGPAQRRALVRRTLKVKEEQNRGGAVRRGTVTVSSRSGEASGRETDLGKEKAERRGSCARWNCAQPIVGLVAESCAALCCRLMKWRGAARQPVGRED